MRLVGRPILAAACLRAGFSRAKQSRLNAAQPNWHKAVRMLTVSLIEATSTILVRAALVAQAFSIPKARLRALWQILGLWNRDLRERSAPTLSLAPEAIDLPGLLQPKPETADARTPLKDPSQATASRRFSRNNPRRSTLC
jgi:hypothetical protein